MVGVGLFANGRWMSYSDRHPTTVPQHDGSPGHAASKGDRRCPCCKSQYLYFSFIGDRISFLEIHIRHHKYTWGF